MADEHDSSEAGGQAAGDQGRHHGRGTEDKGADRREPRLRDLARRLLREPDAPEDEFHEAKVGRTREVLGAVLETGDKAKTEMVRMLAREVRAYLEELRVGQDLMYLLTNYSLEVNASFSLSPLAEKEARSAPKGARLRPVERPAPAPVEQGEE